MSGWSCPDCGRTFARKNAQHSCVRITVASHFEGRPEKDWAIFEKLREEMADWEDIRTDATKSTVNFSAKNNFASLKFPKAHLTIEFVLPEEENVFPVIKTMRVNSWQIGHWVVLETLEDVDAQLMRWLRISYETRGLGVKPD